MALSVVLTVLASLSMTIGICFFFGLEFSGKERGKQVNYLSMWKLFKNIGLIVSWCLDLPVLSDHRRTGKCVGIDEVSRLYDVSSRCENSSGSRAE